jgi:soluble lytic murein transglycosylase-like protein
MPKYKHPIPPKRRRRQRVGWLALGLAVLGALVMAAPTVEREPIATSDPYYIVITPAPSPTPNVWVRYSIALDDAIQRYITSQAEAREIDPALVMAIIQEESQCDTLAIGDEGKSWGLMQIQPSAHQGRIDRLGVTDLLDPYQNVDVGIDYLAELSGKGNGLAWTVMAYNGGESYANRMTASGQVSNYAIEVMELYEAIAESAQVMVAAEQP